MAEDRGGQEEEPITIKKYANRRLYNTKTSSYVTLENLCQMVKEGQDFVVYDAKTGEDITHQILTQIIFEEEGKGQNLLPVRFLRQLIRFYGHSLEALVPGYLELSMESFTRNQAQIREHMAEAFGDLFPFSPYEELNRQNLAMFERAMNMFGTFAASPGKDEDKDTDAAAGSERPAEDEIAELRRKLTDMERQLDALAKK